MSTAKHDGNDENGVTRRRYARLPLALLPMAILLIGGCDVVLGIDSPIRSPRDAGPRPATAEDEDAGATGSEKPVPPDLPPECEDGVLRCDDSTSGNRSKCTKGKWTEHEPCDAKQQCDSQDGALCKALPVEGEPCDEPGVPKCAGVAKPERRICDEAEMVWVDTDPCASGEACDRTDGSCLPIVPVCVGHMPGDFVCDGATRHTCGQDLTASVPAECMSAAHCQQSKGATCAICTQGQFMCMGAMLQTCNAAGNGWTLMTACATEALCNPVAGACTTATCTEGQRRCSGNLLQVCNPELTGWDMMAECPDGLCDQAHGQCDACSASRCDEHTSLICSDDGQTLDTVECPGVCTGRGECVECAAASDCPEADGCRRYTCTRGRQCEMSVGELGSPCGDAGSVCDMTGVCVDDWSLEGLSPTMAAVRDLVTIRAKPGRLIHDPSLMMGVQAVGTSVVLREDGAMADVPPAQVLVAEPSGTRQQISIRVPPRADGWVETELVSVLVRYMPPTPSTPPPDGGVLVSPGTESIGALELRYAP